MHPQDESTWEETTAEGMQAQLRAHRLQFVVEIDGHSYALEVFSVLEKQVLKYMAYVTDLQPKTNLVAVNGAALNIQQFALDAPVDEWDQAVELGLELAALAYDSEYRQN